MLIYIDIAIYRPGERELYNSSLVAIFPNSSAKKTAATFPDWRDFERIANILLFAAQMVSGPGANGSHGLKTDKQARGRTRNTLNEFVACLFQ